MPVPENRYTRQRTENTVFRLIRHGRFQGISDSLRFGEVARLRSRISAVADHAIPLEKLVTAPECRSFRFPLTWIAVCSNLSGSGAECAAGTPWSRYELPRGFPASTAIALFQIDWISKVDAGVSRSVNRWKFPGIQAMRTRRGQFTGPGELCTTRHRLDRVGTR